jgi:hypothetical protein
MIDDWQIQRAMRIHLDTVTEIPTKEYRAWENKHFDPPEDQDWITETMIHGEEDIVANDEVKQIGIYQLDLMTPLGSSIKEAKAVATAIKQKFKPYTSLTGDITVTITKSQIAGGFRSGAWYQIPVRIYYKTYSTNN